RTRGDRYGRDDAPASRPRRLEPEDRGRKVRADLSPGALLDAQEGLGVVPRPRAAADALRQRAAVRVAAGRSRPDRVHAGRTEPDARAHGGADTGPHARTH